MESSSKTAVLLDPYPIWLHAISSLLSRIDIDVVHATRSPIEALDLVERSSPDVVVAELSAADDDLDGIGFVRQARARVPGVKVIVFSAYDDRQHIEAALGAGAVAYVVKTADPQDFASAVRQAFDHSIYFPAPRTGSPATVSAPLRESPGLTGRETEILKLVAEGYTNAQLARMLWLTEQTVKFHLSNVYRKLDVANRTEAGRWAQMHGLLNDAAA
jgi:DNA-binding NarL/FixJ family response regulator